MFPVCSQASKQGPMTKPAKQAPDALESDVDAAIALCDGDVSAALRAALVYNHFLERGLEIARAMVSSGYARGKISPPRPQVGSSNIGASCSGTPSPGLKRPQG
jgi:hypothetical protein